MRTCIIIPMYNEALRFKPEVLSAYTSKHEVDFLLVNDGSSDNTASIINNLSNNNPHTQGLHLTKNSGKAEAIRQGVLKVVEDNQYSHIGYFDADFATPLSEIDNLIDCFSNNSFSLVMGSRIKRLGATIKRFRTRHVGGRLIATIISEIILQFPVYDTQCGAKLMTCDIAKTVFNTPFITKWLFDVELLARLQQTQGRAYCLQSVYELPLTYWEDKGQSKISLTDVLRLPFQLTKLYFHYTTNAKTNT